MTILLSLSGLIYMIILSIIFFRKDKITSNEIRMYRVLMIVTLISLIAELAIPIINYFNLLFIRDYALKVYLVCVLSWTAIFLLYVFSISHGQLLSKFKHIIISIYVVINVFLAGMLFVLPIYFFQEGNSAYSHGPSVDFLISVTGVYAFIIVAMVIIDFKHIKSRKYLPVIVLLVLLVISAIIQRIYPDMLIINYVYTITIFIMYFTIENPDLKMMEELYKNRKLIEKSNEDHSNFIFKMTQDVKKPIQDIINISSDSTDEKLKEINNLGKNLDYLIDDALDVSQMTTKKLKLYNTRYNPKNLFNEIKYRAESKLKSNVKLEYHISSNTPEYVYGDSIKIKQILSSILDNSIDHTKDGYITLEINTIIKYGICRFIIDVTDNGEGISIDKVNEILSFKDTDETFDPDKESLTLREIKLLTNKIGGSFMIKSEEEKGSTVSVTIDQKIVETKEKEISKKLDLYEESLHKNKKIIVVDDDAKELSQITSYLEEKELSVSGSLFGRDVIEKIGNSHKFDLIILDDETSTYSAYEVLKELKKHEKFSAPVVIMIDDSKEFIKLHYLQDGFADVIMKSKLKSELDRILKRF